MEMNLDEDYAAKGRWTIGGEECDATFKYEKNGRMYLEYIDAKGLEIRKGIGAEKENAISGILAIGKLVTVFGVHSSGWKMHLPGMTEVRARVDYAIIGKSYASLEDVQYDRLWIKMAGVEEWYDLDKMTTDDENGDVTFSIKYINVSRTVKIDESMDLTMTPHINYGKSDEKYLVVDRSIVFEFRSVAMRSFDCWTHVIEKIQLFMSILIGCPVYPKVIKAGSGEDQYGYWDADVVVMPYERNANWHKRRDTPKLSMLGGVFDLAISKWFAEYEEIYRYFVSLYVRPMYHEGSFWVNEYLDAVRCLEVYHRLTFHGTRMDTCAYDSHVAMLVQLIDDEDFKTIVADSLKYANELRLNNRLKEVLSSCRKYFMPKLDIKGESHRISSARNYYTHFDKSKSSDELDVYDGVRYTRMLWKATEIFLFRQLGASEELIQAMNDRHMFTRQLPKRKSGRK